MVQSMKFGEARFKKITVDRDSVCMGDDCESHNKIITINKNITIFQLLLYLVDYVPSMKNVVWVIHSNLGLCGYIIMNEQAKATIEVYKAETIVEAANINNIMCKYYYPFIFSWIDGKSGKRVNKYPECKTFFEKVRKDSER